MLGEEGSAARREGARKRIDASLFLCSLSSFPLSLVSTIGGSPVDSLFDTLHHSSSTMLRRSSVDGGNVIQASEQKVETASNHELDSPTREVVIDDQHPCPGIDSSKQNGSTQPDLPPPPPPLILAQSPSKLNGDSSSSKPEGHKCAGCGFTTRSLPDLLDHGRHCPSSQEGRNCPSSQEGSRSPSKQSSSNQSSSKQPSSKQSSSSATLGSKCTMCTQVFASLEDQIRHMTDFHKLKASFKCSFCRLSFSSKELIEAHIKTHANKSSSSVPRSPSEKKVESGTKASKDQDTDPIVSEDNNDSISDEMEEVDCLVCGKSFKDPVEHKKHETSCTGPEEMSDDPANTEGMEEEEGIREEEEGIRDEEEEGSREGEEKEYPAYFQHFKHDHINLVTDPDNPYCKGCDKQMANVLGICNHLSRRHDCREWYCRNLAGELRKADKLREARGIPKPDPLPIRPRGAYARRSNASSGSNSPLPPLPAEEHRSPKRAASLLAQTHMKVASRGQIVEGYEDKTRAVKAVTPTNKRPDGPHSIQCTHCQKVFDGRSPHVGFTNHQRGSPDCRENGTRRFIPTTSGLVSSPNLRIKPVSQSVQSVKSQRSTDSPTVELEEEEGVKNSTQYFYCKLCNDGDPKTRTSLGCHLTVHHGLPPVNCKNGNQDAFRCQTCCVLFNSKHYYNQHRHDCDMKSEYVGFCDKDTSLGPSSTKRSRVRSSAPVQITPKSGSNGLNCSLCGKTGFAGPNAVRIHMKYICINRSKPDSSKDTGWSVSPKVPKLKIKTSSFSPSPVLETRSSRYRDSIPQISVTLDEGRRGSKLVDEGDEGRRGSRSELKCDECGRGPYNNVHHLMEHQKNYCQALKRNSNQNGKRESLQDDLDEIRGSRAAKKFAQEKIMSSGRRSLKGVGDSVRAEEADGSDSRFDSRHLLIDCSVCASHFEGMETFVKHRLDHMTGGGEEGESQEMKCEVCVARVFTCYSTAELQQHLLGHLKKGPSFGVDSVCSKGQKLSIQVRSSGSLLLLKLSSHLRMCCRNP